MLALKKKYAVWVKGRAANKDGDEEEVATVDATGVSLSKTVDSAPHL